MEAIYVLRVHLPEGYDGPVLEEASLMVSALNIINGGEDEVPIRGVSCERSDSAPEMVEGGHGQQLYWRERARELLDERWDDQSYQEGYHDALRELLGEGDA